MKTFETLWLERPSGWKLSYQEMIDLSFKKEEVVYTSDEGIELTINVLHNLIRQYKDELTGFKLALKQIQKEV